MHRLALALGFLLSLAAMGPAGADPALREELLKLFGAHNAALQAGKVKEAAAMKTADMRGQIEDELKRVKGKEREMTLAMLRHSAPDSFEVQHFQPGDDEAELYILASKVAPPQAGADAGKIFRTEMLIGFAREDGAWKVGAMMHLADPDSIKRPEDVSFEPIGSYDEDRTTEFSGRIVSVVSADDHMLVMLRIMDEENAVYLPSSKQLKEFGFNADLLAPYLTVEASGHPHRSKPLKIWATGLNIVR